MRDGLNAARGVKNGLFFTVTFWIIVAIVWLSVTAGMPLPEDTRIETLRADLDVQRRHLLMIARSHDELINQTNSNTLDIQGESGLFNLSEPVCYGCHTNL